jgi:HAD superfamily hydrolase (TIGR01484 family)
MKYEKSKVLFVSDLDGTLLTPQAVLRDGDAERINALTARGLRITYATARTIESAGKILGNLRFAPDAPPVSLMNGVLACDMAGRHYVDSAKFSTGCAREILRCMKESDSYPFIYSLIPGERLMTHYTEIRNPAMQAFMDERKVRYGKPFRQVSDVSEAEGDIIYFCIIAPEEDVLRAYHSVDNVPGIKRTYYEDSYAPGTWYLEIFDEKASKKHAVEFLRAYTGAEYIVCFGDNRNDLPMFEAADFAVAVPNAVKEAKDAADAIAGDGVVAYIEKFAEDMGW